MNEEEQQAEVVETEVVEEQEQPQERQTLTHDEMIAELRSAGKLPTAPVQEYRQQPSQDVEYIGNTGLVKPSFFDTLSLDDQMGYIADQKASQMMQLTSAASRTAREVESQGEPWYMDNLREVIERMDPVFLARATQEEKAGLVELAKGRAVSAGKLPPNPSKPVPGASPVSTKAPSQSVAASEVDQVLQGIRDAGYAKVADSPRIREILAR